MAEDIKIIWDNDLFEGDVLFANNDLFREEGLETAVMMSLFSDRRAKEDDLINNPDDKKGWWGDQIADIPMDEIGSRLWLLERSKATSETLVLAKEYAEESLEWMIDDGVAISIEVTSENIYENILKLTVKIYKKFDELEVFKFDNLWNAQYKEAS